MHHLTHRFVLSLAPLLAAVSLGIAAPVAMGEEPAAPPPATAANPIPADQLEQLVAPIALYPDALIAQILMASTYPLDVVQADRWLEDQDGLEGEALQTAVDPEPWDDSVKALVFFPSVLGFMSDNLDWTQDLGDAVLAQQGELTDTIQRLRGEADTAGALKSNEQQRVEKAGDTIVIQPAQPEVVYVPTYDPVKVYGQSAPPAKEYYPDAYADASASYEAGYAAGRAAGESATSYVPGGTVVPAETVYPATTSVVTTDDSTDQWLSFGAGALAGGLLTAAIMWDDNDNWNDRLYYGGPGYYGGAGYWGGANYWNNNGWREPSNINIDRSRDIQRNVERGDVTINRGIVGNEVNRWEHNAERRGGVRYRDASTEQRFAARRQESGIDRDAARGRANLGDRDLRAPDLGTVRREGAATGGTTRLAEGRDAGGRIGDRQGPAGDRQARSPDRDQVRDQGRREGAAGGRAEGIREQRPGGGEARAKAQARAPEARAKAPTAKAKPRAQPAAATKRPVNREAARPAAAQVKRPERAAAQPQRPAATRASAPKSSAFQQSSRSSTARAASNRGGASRASAGGRGGGGGRTGGGGRGGGRR
ncbi:MAG: DUF3300 domain-containing protein [Bdellovibrio bacteriovorus]